MLRRAYVITHPDVVVSLSTPVTEWPLSAVGRERMRRGMVQPWWQHVTSIVCSAERKATDAAEIAGNHLFLSWSSDAELGENDRSATGFLPPPEFERTADEFFSNPEQSVRGWERAVDAQRRMVGAVERVIARDRTHGHIAILCHGAVGTLLYCWLSGSPISRKWDQPANGGGNYFSFELQSRRVCSWWQAMDAGAI